jgi:hypothetical protein
MSSNKKTITNLITDIKTNLELEGIDTKKGLTYKQKNRVLKEIGETIEEGYLKLFETTEKIPELIEGLKNINIDITVDDWDVTNSRIGEKFNTPQDIILNSLPITLAIFDNKYIKKYLLHDGFDEETIKSYFPNI